MIMKKIIAAQIHKKTAKTRHFFIFRQDPKNLAPHSSHQFRQFIDTATNKYNNINIKKIKY